MYLSKNLRYLRLKHGLSQDVLAEKFGYKSYTTIQKWEMGTSEPSISVLSELSNLYHVDMDSMMGVDLEKRSDPERHTAQNSHSYIFIPESVHAGSPFTIEAIRDEDLPQILIPDILLGKHAGNRDIVAMKVNGESMNNVIPNGSYIAIWVGEEMPELRDDDIVVFSNNGEYSLKRFYDDKANERLIFRPDSSDRSFTDIIYNYDDLENFKIIGKVIMYCVSL